MWIVWIVSSKRGKFKRTVHSKNDYNCTGPLGCLNTAPAIAVHSGEQPATSHLLGGVAAPTLLTRGSNITKMYAGPAIPHPFPLWALTSRQAEGNTQQPYGFTNRTHTHVRARTRTVVQADGVLPWNNMKIQFFIKWVIYVLPLRIDRSDERFLFSNG